MKQLSFLSLCLCLSSAGFAQQNVGINTTSPHPSAALDVSSTTQGMLVPRMTEAQRTGIASPAQGLLVYQTDNTAGFYYHNGSAWTSLNSPASPLPAQSGNSGKYLSTDGTTAGWATAPGPSLQLYADKTGGVSENPPVSASTSPVTIAFNNIVDAPTNSSTWNGSTFTAGQAGVYLFQIRVHTPDASPVTSTVPVSLLLQVNGTAYGSVGNIYGIYPSLGPYTPAGTKGRGELLAFVRLKSGDTVKVLAISANSSTPSQAISADAGSNITVLKIN